MIRQICGEHEPLFRSLDTEQWQYAETQLRQSLSEFSHNTQATTQGRLFAEDALEGLRLIDLTHLLEIFVERGLELLRPGGRLGAITSRTCFFLFSFQKWREDIVLGVAEPEVIADLGYGVMDEAMVEAAAYVLKKRMMNDAALGQGDFMRTDRYRND